MVANESTQLARQFDRQARSALASAEVGLSIPAQHDAAKVFLREFTRELYREIHFKTKLVALLLFVAVVSGLVYLARSAVANYRAQNQLNQTLIGDQSKRIDQHDLRLQQMKEQTDQSGRQLTDLQRSNTELLQTNRNVLAQLSLAPQLWTEYANGVCLIAGSYVLIDPATQRPLRYPENETSESERLLTTGTQEQLTPEGNGDIFELEFVGTGFHVGQGFVLTNRHVAGRPWAADTRAQLLISITGAEPKVSGLWADFPGHRRPLRLNAAAVSDTYDLAVSRLDPRALPADLPALRLDPADDEVRVGQAIVTMGYPTGPRRLLALLPEDEARGLQERFGNSLTALLDQLAQRGLIKPLTVTGHISDLFRDRIVFDAATSEGGSGTPLFGESGDVVGITFAEFTDERASNFALPIGRARELLRRVGWQPLPSMPAKP